MAFRVIFLAKTCLHNGVTLQVPKRRNIFYAQTKNVSFMNKRTGEELWKSVTSVSNVGRKKGRARGKRSKDLNRGQILGKGTENYVWPGLNAPVTDQTQGLLKIVQLPVDTEYLEGIRRERDKTKFGGFRTLKLNPLDRGYSGTKWHGRKLGPPPPIGNMTFEGFETICLEFKTIIRTSGTMGKQRIVSAFAVTGNRNGTIGFGKGVSADQMVALRKAKSHCSKRLVTFPLYNNRTIYHNIYSRFNHTKLYLKKVPPGHGLVCQRIVKSICQVLGIKDIYAKIEGSTTPQSVCRTFLNGLMNQYSHQEVADQTGLYIVEQHPDKDNYPVIVGVPNNPRSSLSKKEKLQVQIAERFLTAGKYFADGEIQHINPTMPWYFDEPHYHLRAWQWHQHRNKFNAMIRLWASENEWDQKFQTRDTSIYVIETKSSDNEVNNCRNEDNLVPDTTNEAISEI